jgi:4-amino-4-deoxy-L-arabinose transferase-like glycosyltransferase
MFLQKRGLLLLAGCAMVYYAFYLTAGLKLTGEQGSNALIAMRILDGERPIADMFIGYNLLWFYPLVGIFDLIGPNWLAMRAYFFFLAGMASLLGFVLVRRVTGQAWLALLAGLLMVLMPGAIFRNYLGFIGVLAANLLLRGYVLEAANPRRQMAWMAAAGTGLSVCFLIRIEPGLLISVVWAGLVVLYPLAAGRGQFVTRLRTVVFGTALALLAFAAVHAPFVIHAYQRGFGPEFTAQYSGFARMLQDELVREMDHWTKRQEAPSRAADEAVTGPTTVPAAPLSPASLEDDGDSPAEFGGRDGRRSLPAPSRVFSSRGIYFFAAAIWYPVLLAPLLVMSGGVMLVFALVRSDPRNKEAALVVLATTGCALSLFPQYFFFRPDSTHLTEFLLVFWPASFCSAWVIRTAAVRSGKFWLRLWSWLLVTLTALLVVVSFNALFGREASGSIRSARGANALFEAANGVRSKVRVRHLADWEGLRDTVVAHSAPGDFVITYPYVPIVNVMCDRPTYQWRLYVDNAVASPGFLADEIKRFRAARPAVVVINNRAINRTEFSRFRNWAAPFYEVVANDYVLVGEFFGEIEVFARPDSVRTVDD